MIYAYGICDSASDRLPPRGRGLGGAWLRVLRSGELAAIYSRHRSLRVRPVTEQLLRHERAIEQTMELGPVLPLRFGTKLETEEQLAAVLARRERQLLHALDRVRGHVELGLRVVCDHERNNNGAVDRPSGREFVLTRVSEHQCALRLARELHDPLAQLATASTVREFPRAPAILVASYLVPREGIAGFRREAHRLGARQDETRVLITGPWPPYSFVEEEQQ